MTAIVSIIFFVFLGYLALGVFQYYFGLATFLIGWIMEFIKFPLDWIDIYLFPINNSVYLIYSFLIFFFLFKIFKSVFINKK